MSLPFKNKAYPNTCENSFQEFAATQGWTVTKRGWPDFMVFDQDDGFLFFVEVKRNKKQRHALTNVNQTTKRKKRKTQHFQFQARTMSLLRQAGFDCRIWTPVDGFGS